MGHVEQRRPGGRACVEDFEDRLKKSVQVHYGPRIAFKYKRLVPVVPPSVGRSARQRHPLSRAYGESAIVEHSRQRAGPDDPFFILRDVNMERRPLPMCGEQTFQFQPHFVAPLYTPHRQPLAAMPILDNQLANTALGHHISCLERRLTGWTAQLDLAPQLSNNSLLVCSMNSDVSCCD